MFTEACGCRWDERADCNDRRGLVIECGYHGALEDSVRDLRAALAAEREAHEATKEALKLAHESNVAAWREMPNEGVRMEERTLAQCIAALRAERDDERAWNFKRRETYDRIGKALEPFREKRSTGEPARDDATEVEAVCAKLAEYEERYRPRWHGEEPAPKDEVVHVWDAGLRRWLAWPGERVPDDAWWAHQPPAPSEEGE